MLRFITIVFFISTVSFAQESKDKSRKFLKESIEIINQNYRDVSINPYFKGDVFYLDFEIKTPTLYNDLYFIRQELKNHSKDYLYNYTKNVLTKGILYLLKNESEANYINYQITYLSSEYKSISFTNIVQIADLQKISEYFNKQDFYNLLSKKF